MTGEPRQSRVVKRSHCGANLSYAVVGQVDVVYLAGLLLLVNKKPKDSCWSFRPKDGSPAGEIFCCLVFMLPFFRLLDGRFPTVYRLQVSREDATCCRA